MVGILRILARNVPKRKGPKHVITNRVRRRTQKENRMPRIKNN